MKESILKSVSGVVIILLLALGSAGAQEPTYDDGSGAASFEQDVFVYQMTETDIPLKAGLKAMKFWRNDGLNKNRKFY